MTLSVKCFTNGRADEYPGQLDTHKLWTDRNSSMGASAMLGDPPLCCDKCAGVHNCWPWCVPVSLTCLIIQVLVQYKYCWNIWWNIIHSVLVCKILIHFHGIKDEVKGNWSYAFNMCWWCCFSKMECIRDSFICFYSII